MNQTELKPPKNFALIGAAGYIAPRHMRAIKETGNNLIAALDVSDSVGVLDQYFDEVDFFTEFERFDRHVDLLRRKQQGKEIHYVSICSPNYLHDAHMRFALRSGAYAICEKPLVLNPWNLDALEEVEHSYQTKIYNLLQLRVHPTILALKEKVDQSPSNNTKANIDLTYVTTRGKWYFYSWKGQLEKSGGIATNIGIHFFDMLIWIYGKVQATEVIYADEKKIRGFLELERANVRWFLSLDKADLPASVLEKCKRTYRSIRINDEEIEFSDGFTDLHTKVYEDILSGKGYGISAARPSIELAYQIRHATPASKKNSPLPPWPTR